jgi:hypothetical protein
LYEGQYLHILSFVEGQLLRAVLGQKVADGLAFAPPAITRRDVRLSAIPHKARAVIGMRRSGKTSFLHQVLADRLAAGVPRAVLVPFNFEDERLAGLQASQLHWILEEYYVRVPELRGRRPVTFFFDEIQSVPGWETFVRRILDEELAEVFVSGSSARMLSREVATSLRGRATETVIFPFSFRESLRHRGAEPDERPALYAKAKRSALERAFRDYLVAGGFPEAQGLAAADQVELLQGYVDVCILRDVVERHGVTNVVALRRLVRHLLSAPAAPFSVHKFTNDLRSQGVAISKDLVHEMLAHLQDAFLVRVVSMATSSERQRNVNPRKVYPVDPGLIPAFDRSGKANTGHALETAVLVELERRGGEVAYIRTPEGHEVDFLWTARDGKRRLVQVADDLTARETRDREFGALESARPQHRGASALLLTGSAIDTELALADAPRGVEVRTAWEWMLER